MRVVPKQGWCSIGCWLHRVSALGSALGCKALQSSGRVFGGALLMLVSGCALIPPEPVVTGPLTAEPTPVIVAQPEANGSIYQAAAHGYRPLFEDRRPRNVGDIVTIVIQERTNASKSVATSSKRGGSASLGLDNVPAFFPPGFGPQQGFELSGGNQADGGGSSRADNTFTGTLTTTVIGVLPNGNLQVAGEKQMAINRGSEYIRFSGVVDPSTITGSNTVPSTLVADARIEFRSKGRMDEVQTMGWLQRFFLTVSPF